MLLKAHADGQELNRIHRATNGNDALGNSRFQEQAEATPGKCALPGKPARPPKQRKA